MPSDHEINDPVARIKKAIAKDDARLAAELFTQHPELKARINEPLGPFDSPAITNVRSREMLDVLLTAGADINGRSQWWAGGFGILDSIKPEFAPYAISRGAVVDAHSAARLGMIEKLRELIAANPDLVNARGGDGQSPLHFASTVEISKLLVEHGADINARDIDHESTPAQYMVRDRQEIVRYLIQRGCKTDILLAAAIGDASRVRQHLDSNPESIRTRVNDEFFPKANPHSGGTIYQWTLGWHISPHEVAKQFGHREVFDLLIERSPDDVKLLVYCWTADETNLSALLARKQDLGRTLPERDRIQIAHAARNNNTKAVRLFLKTGLPVDALGQHGATPLHWAGFHGNPSMVREILRFNPPLEVIDSDFDFTPLGWAIYGSQNGWHCQTGDYPAAVEALLEAGAKVPDKVEGTEAVAALIKRFAAQT